MPLYEYRCKQCDRVFEVMQKFSDAPLTTHADCGGEVERLISAPGLHFKGSGWYITDYARGGGSGKSDSKSDSKKDSASSSDSKSESKSESKPAAPASTSTSKD